MGDVASSDIEAPRRMIHRSALWSRRGSNISTRSLTTMRPPTGPTVPTVNCVRFRAHYRHPANQPAQPEAKGRAKYWRLYGEDDEKWVTPEDCGNRKDEVIATRSTRRAIAALHHVAIQFAGSGSDDRFMSKTEPTLAFGGEPGGVLPPNLEASSEPYSVSGALPLRARRRHPPMAHSP